MPEYLTIDIKHKLLRNRRLNISADTTSKRTRDARKASLWKLLERGDVDVVEAVRERRIHVAEVDHAVREGSYDELKRRAAQKAGPLPQAIDKAIAELEGSRELGTIGTYRVAGNALLFHFGDARMMDEITREELRDFLHADKATGKPWTSNTKRQLAITCRRIWQLAGADVEVWKGIELPKMRKTRVVFLSPEEWRKVIAANDRMPHAAVLGLGCLAGLRGGEIANLRTGVDLDLERRIIRIQPRQGAYPWKPKNDRAIRDVPISEELIGILQFHAETYAGEKYFVRVAGKDEPMHVNIIGRWTKVAMRRGGLTYGRKLNGYTAHTMRHTFASWLAQRDVQLLKIAALLGDTPEIVASTYAHLTPRDLDRAVGVIDDVVRNAKQQD